jgi:hypothetical protein
MRVLFLLLLLTSCQSYQPPGAGLADGVKYVTAP